MTTIISIKGQGYCLIMSDRAVTAGGHLRFPEEYNKLGLITPNIIVGGAGDISEIQNLSRLCLRTMRVNAMALDSFLISPDPRDFSKQFSEMLFKLKLEFKHFSASEFIIAGNDEGEVILISLGGDGGLIELSKFWAIGSGSEPALGILQKEYREDMKPEDAAVMAIEALSAANRLDSFTGQMVNAYLIDSQEINPVSLQEVEIDGKKVFKLVKPGEEKTE